MNTQKPDFQSLTGIRQNFLGEGKDLDGISKGVINLTGNSTGAGHMRWKFLRGGLEKSVFLDKSEERTGFALRVRQESLLKFPRGHINVTGNSMGEGHNEVEIPKGWPGNSGFLNRGGADKNWNGPIVILY